MTSARLSSLQRDSRSRKGKLDQERMLGKCKCHPIEVADVGDSCSQSTVMSMLLPHRKKEKMTEMGTRGEIREVAANFHLGYLQAMKSG